MKKAILILAAGSLLYSCTPPASEIKVNESDSTATRLERGKYLVTIGGCHDCHSPKIMSEQGPVPDPALLLSGHPGNIPLPPSDTATSKNWILFFPMGTAAKGPWGTSFAANLTPDVTGIGNWTEQQFFNAMRKGWYKGMEGTRMLLPLMPWQGYANLTDEDLRSIFAYLKSLPPIANVVPAPVPPGQ